MAGELPHLAEKSEGCEITSPETKYYNCIAWAAGDSSRNWWPLNYSYWPRGVARELTLDAFIQAFGTLGYEPCKDGKVEKNYEKIVLYLLNGEPTHAARQLSDGRWSSKLGKAHDVSHRTVRGVEGPCYGKATQYMRRRVGRSLGTDPATPTSDLASTEGHDTDDGPAPVE